MFNADYSLLCFGYSGLIFLGASEVVTYRQKRNLVCHFQWQLVTYLLTSGRANN